jgi:hypothetical protein
LYLVFKLVHFVREVGSWFGFKQAMMTKQDMMIQREAVFGTSKEAGEILDKKFRVPTLPL